MKGHWVKSWSRFGVAVILLSGGCNLAASGAWARGVGVHIAGGVGEHAHRQLGLSWDTAVATDRLFNYRLDLGYEAFELDQFWGERDPYAGIIAENTFGFRLLANRQWRLWAGPQVVVGIYEGDVGLGTGLALGFNRHLSDTASVAVTLGGRAMEYSGILGGDESESIGFVRLALFYRFRGDRFGGGL